MNSEHGIDVDEVIIKQKLMYDGIDIDEVIKMSNDLKCCGNCKKYVENRNCYNMRPGSYCHGWLPDGLTRKDRE